MLRTILQARSTRTIVNLVWVATALSCRSPSEPEPLLERATAALSIPLPGGEVVIGFESPGAPLARGELLDEQYADSGVHFNGAFFVGDRTVDFPDFTRPPLTEKMLCTWVAWADTGRCFEPLGGLDARLEVELDFDACEVEIEARTRGDGEQDRDVLLMEGFNAAGGLVDSQSLSVSNEPPPFQPEGLVLGLLTGTVANPIRRVVIDDGTLDSLDTLRVRRCEPNPPPVALCADRTTCNLPGLCVGDADIDNGSFDPDGEPITLTYSPARPYPVGTTQATLTVSDPNGSATCSATVVVNDCEPPAILCPAPVTIECTGDGCGHHIPGDATATDNCGPVTVSPAPAPACFPLGTTSLTYTAVDAAGNQASCTTTVTVVDTQPPNIPPEPLDGGELWPPNHKYHTVTLADCGTLIDTCQGPVSLTAAGAEITCVSSDEPENDGGDGNTSDDIVIVDATTVRLRAERAGSRDGRVYTIGFRVTDAAGNTSHGTCTVSTPHNPGQPAINSGPMYTVCR